MTRGRNRRGRPKQDGARYPSGKLKPPEPNQVTIDRRKALMGDTKGDLSSAEDAMKLALARGWLTEEQHRAGEAYARTYALAFPKKRGGGLSEAPDARDADKRTIAQMGSAEIVAAFDSILDATVMPSHESRFVSATRRYGEMSAAMTGPEQAEVFACFCSRSWPQWVIQRAAGHDTTSWERKRDLLVAGLDVLAAHLRGEPNRGSFRNVRVA